MTRIKTFVPGLRAPALFISAALAALCVPSAAMPQTAPPISAQPVPGDLELAKLIWSTMAMVDHANRSGNYSVLRDTSASGFQINNDPARLAEVFASLRAQRIDLSNALLVVPNYIGAPLLVQPDVFEVRGYFGLRPTAIFFDLYFQWEQGRWKLYGISIEPRAMAGIQPESGAAPAAKPGGQPAGKPATPPKKKS